jgi:hypothetical protein
MEIGLINLIKEVNLRCFEEDYQEWAFFNRPNPLIIIQMHFFVSFNFLAINTLSPKAGL